MTTVSNLSVVIGADIGGLNQGLQNAQRGVKNFGNQVGSTSDQMRGFLRNTDGSFIGVGQSISGLNKKMKDLGLGFLPAAGAASLVGVAIKGSIGAAIEFESAFANVAKTVDASDEELAALRGTLRDMATSDSPVGALENSLITLTDIAAAAGQLGVATEDIASFSETMAMLGVATDLTATDAAVFAARFANVTGMSFDNIDELGDMLVTLGNNMATTESEIAGFASRLSPLANYDWDPASILGYSAALSALGVSAELGGTNLNKSVADMTTAVAVGGPKLQVYADIAGTTAASFKELAGEDSQAAFQQFIAGLAGLDADQQILQLNKLGITSVEQITTLQRLAGGLGTLTQSLDLAEEGWAGNGAVMTEAAAKADTSAGRIERLKNNLNELGVKLGELVLPVVDVFVDVTTRAVGGVMEVASEGSDLIKNVITAVVQQRDNIETSRFAARIDADFKVFLKASIAEPISGLLDGVNTLLQTEVAGVEPFKAAVNTVLSLIAPPIPAVLQQFNTVLDEVSKVGPTGESPFVRKLYMSTPIEIIPGVIEVMPSGRPWLDTILNNIGDTAQRIEQAVELAIVPRLSMINPETGEQFGRPLPPMLTEPISADVTANLTVYPSIANVDELATDVGSQAATIIRDAPPTPADSDIDVTPVITNSDQIVSGVQTYLQGLNYDTTVTADVTVNINKFYEDNPEFGGYTPGQQKPVPGYDGSHAGGLSYVPRDNYLAQLHQGERVLTAEENMRYSGGGRAPIIVNLTNFGGNMQEAAEMIRRALKDAAL